MASGCLGDRRFHTWVRPLWVVVGFITNFVVLRGVEGAPFFQVRTAIGLKARLPCSTEITGQIHVQWLDPSGTTLTYDESVEVSDPRFKINHSYLKEWNLEIDNVRRSDAGNYTCNIGPTILINNMVELIIVVAPSIVSSSQASAFLVGSDVNLTCLASGDPLPVISWSRLGNSNGDNKIDLGFEGTTLRIPSIAVKDAGTYMCQANNGVPPTAFERMRIDVLFPPETSVLYRDASQEEGGSTLMTCLIRANPATDLYWERSGQRLAESPKYQVQRWEVGEYQTTLGLFVNGLVTEDFGVYKCVATNEFGRAEEQIRINEFHIDSVRVLVTPKDSLARVGDDVFFECSVHGIDDGNSLTWWYVQHDGKEHRRIFASHPSPDFVEKRTGRSIVETNTDWSTDDTSTGRSTFETNTVRSPDNTSTGRSTVRSTVDTSTSRSTVQTSTGRSTVQTSTGRSTVQTSTGRSTAQTSTSLSAVNTSKVRSSAESDLFDSAKYAVHGHYGLLVRNVGFTDSGTYVCNISGHRNYSAELRVVDTSLSCENNETLVNDGDAVYLVCSIAFRGLASDFRIAWLHDEEPVWSVRDDDVSRVRLTLGFNASYPHSSGVYRCYVSSQQFNYSATCRTELTVLSAKTGGNIFPCFNLNISSSCDYSSTTNALILISLVSTSVVLLITYIVTVCCLVTAHRRELAKYKEPQQRKEKSWKNGNVDVELTPLTCTSPTPSS